MSMWKILFATVVFGVYSGHTFAQCDFGSNMVLNDVEGYVWDIQYNGTISNGTGDAFDVAMALQVDGAYFPFQASVSTELSGRQVVAGPAAMSGLNVTRKVYVPSSGTDGWARHVDVFQNPTGSPISVNLIYESNPGSDGSTTVDASFDGDTIFESTDHWVVTDDTSGSGDPTNSINIFNGIEAGLVPTSVSTTVFDCAGPQGSRWDYALTVPANGTVAVMAFIAQSNTTAEAIATAQTLDALPLEAMFGLQGAEAQPANWLPSQPATPVPALSVWALIIFGVVLLGFGIRVIGRHKRIAAS